MELLKSSSTIITAKSQGVTHERFNREKTVGLALTLEKLLRNKK